MSILGGFKYMARKKNLLWPSHELKTLSHKRSSSSQTFATARVTEICLGIIVAAAAPRLPQMLFDQLKEGGRIVIPIGPSDAQELQLVTKVEGKPVVTGQTGCRFVPLVGEHGYQD
jgi:hypothetical protein